MKLMTLLGKRSEIIKLSLILRVLDQHSEHILVNTGEHTDENLSDIFIRDLEVRSPDVDLREMGSPPRQEGIDRKVATLIKEFAPERLLVVSDSMSANAAANTDVPIYEFDAGRNSASPSKNASAVLLPFANSGRDNLLRNGADPSRVFVVGNPSKEILDNFEERIETSGVMGALGLNPFDFFLATVHRGGNLGQGELTKVIEALGTVAAKFGKKVLFVVHPVTASRIEEFNIAAPQNVRLLRSLNYFDFVKLEKNALAVLTDSTTVQEECSVLRVPTVTLGTTTPRIETVTCGSNILAGIEAENMIRAIEISIAQAADWEPPQEYTRTNVSQIVSKILLGARVRPPSIRPFDFESFGVNIRITGCDQELIDWGEAIARKALIDDLRILQSNTEFSTIFDLSYDDGRVKLLQDGRLEGLDAARDHIKKYFNSLIRVAVAENAADKMFIHAGAVGWKGRGIIFPGTSFVGKSTLVAELVRHGADYFSDDYAIFDTDGFLYPFPRMLSMRKDEPGYTPYEVTAAELGGKVGRGPMKVGLVCFTEYGPEAEWEPNQMTPGQATLEMVPYTFSFVNRPEFSLSVLNRIVDRAIIVSGKRGSADKFAKTFLNFVDKLPH